MKASSCGSWEAPSLRNPQLQDVCHLTAATRAGRPGLPPLPPTFHVHIFAPFCMGLPRPSLPFSLPSVVSLWPREAQRRSLNAAAPRQHAPLAPQPPGGHHAWSFLPFSSPWTICPPGARGSVHAAAALLSETGSRPGLPSAPRGAGRLAAHRLPGDAVSSSGCPALLPPDAASADSAAEDLGAHTPVHGQGRWAQESSARALSPPMAGQGVRPRRAAHAPQRGRPAQSDRCSHTTDMDAVKTISGVRGVGSAPRAGLLRGASAAAGTEPRPSRGATRGRQGRSPQL